MNGQGKDYYQITFYTYTRIFGSKDNIPHSDTNHEEDWHCLHNFLNCLNNSHGEVFISLNDKEKNKMPESYKENILNWTEGGFKREETTETPRTEERRDRREREEPQNKTIQGWYEDKKITYQDYKLLTTPWAKEKGGDLYVYEVELDIETLYSWEEITDYLRRAKLAKRKAEEEKRREEEIKRKMNDGKDWSSISLDFQQEGEWTYKRNWVGAGFTYSQCKEWIDIGMRVDNEDFAFCAWLRDEKKVSASWVLNFGNVERLREEWNSTHTYWG